MIRFTLALAVLVTLPGLRYDLLQAHPLPQQSVVADLGMTADLDTLCAWVTGRFTNAEQHRRDTSVPECLLVIEQQSGTEPAERRFSVRLYRGSDSSAPFQAFAIQVLRLEEGIIEVKLFTSNETAQTGQALFGCEWYLQYSGHNFIGGTHGFACRIDAKDSYTRVDLDIRNFGIKLWMRSYDASDRLLSASLANPLLFTRLIPPSAK